MTGKHPSLKYRSPSCSLNFRSSSGPRHLVRGIQASPRMKDAKDTLSSKQVLVEHEFSKFPRPITGLDEPLDVWNLVNLRLDRAYVIPGFVTFNIARRYSLEITVEVGCGREKFNLKFPSESRSELSILPLSSPSRHVVH